MRLTALPSSSSISRKLSTTCLSIHHLRHSQCKTVLLVYLNMHCDCPETGQCWDATVLLFDCSNCSLPSKTVSAKFLKHITARKSEFEASFNYRVDHFVLSASFGKWCIQARMLVIFRELLKIAIRESIFSWFKSYKKEKTPILSHFLDLDGVLFTLSTLMHYFLI